MGAWPAAGVGAHFAIEPGRGADAVPLRSTVFGAVVALVALVGALVFGASLHHLLGTPRLYGWNWDVTMEGEGWPVTQGPLPRFLRDDRVRAVAITASGLQIDVDRENADVIVADRVKGDISPVLLEGRAPTGPHDVLLGAVTLRRLGKHVGDTVVVSFPQISANTARMTVVGRGVLPAQNENARLGEGAVVSSKVFAPPFVPEGVFGDDGPTYDSAAITLAPGADLAAFEKEYRRRFDVSFQRAEQPGDLVNFGRVQQLPLVLAGLLALLGTAVLAHLLTTSVRRRRRDLAVMKSLGFTGRQVQRVIGAQAVTITALTVALGVPLGVLAGRWAWGNVAERLGVPARPVVELPVLALVALATVALGVVVASVPARLAARLRPARVLRTE
jgi:hypothetical protein